MLVCRDLYALPGCIRFTYHSASTESIWSYDFEIDSASDQFNYSVRQISILVVSVTGSDSCPSKSESKSVRSIDRSNSR